MQALKGKCFEFFYKLFSIFPSKIFGLQGMQVKGRVFLIWQQKMQF